jgi:hypothetical protein
MPLETIITLYFLFKILNLNYFNVAVARTYRERIIISSIPESICCYSDFKMHEGHLKSSWTGGSMLL